MSETSILCPHGHWEAEIKLGFARIDGATRLVERTHRGPLRVQKALYPEGETVCQAILLHPPSGIAGGDRLHIGVDVAQGAHAQMTTPGAGKWYRSAGDEASQKLVFNVANEGIFEWLPQETIVFDGARSHMETRVNLVGDARYFGWEILCLGRSAAGERFSNGHIDLVTRIERDGRPLWLERGHVEGNDPLLHSRAGWDGNSICGTLLATLPTGFDVASLLEVGRAVAPNDEAEHGLTALPGMLLARYLGHNSEAARLWFGALWQLFRPALLGRAAVPPRIWMT